MESAIDLSSTLFLVSSKSGGTIETLSQFRYFYERLTVEGGDNAGSHFVAITDPGIAARSNSPRSTASAACS